MRTPDSPAGAAGGGGSWAPDPAGAHEYRWWDGFRWTEHVADGGVPGVDFPPAGMAPVVDAGQPPGYGWGRDWSPAAPSGLSFSGAVSRCLRNYANFRGRASRSEYWWFVLFYIAVGVVTVLVAEQFKGSPLYALPGVAWLAFVVPVLASTVRRLHDTGRGGAWMLIQFVPLVGPLLLFVWTVQGSSPQPNRYGPPPR